MNNVQLNTAVVAGVALKEMNGTIKMLLLKRSKDHFWSHISGSIEANETAWQAFIRELKEETGLSTDRLYSADYIEQFYDIPTNRITLVPVFVAYLQGPCEVLLNNEHSHYQWCTLNEAKALTPFSNQHAAYNHEWSNFVVRTPSKHLKI